jgi:fructuronate reductase
MILHPDRLAALPADIATPRYDRRALTIGIVHLGLGAFTRAHQAFYTEAALNRAGGGAWGICGVSLRSPETRDALAPQGGLYTVAVRDSGGEAVHVVGSVTELLVAPENPEAVLVRMAAPNTRIISLTVTEKGYCHDPATGALNEAHPGIIHDLTHPDSPQTAIGYLVSALDRRRLWGLPPFTVLSCDNLPSNGDTVAGIVCRFARLRNAELGAWVEANVPFPNSMVDRIVPATTDADRGNMSVRLGMSDAWPVMTEPFTQWVIEDRFVAGRPAWEQEGAELVEDVRPYEHMKLRLLNGSHSTLSYLGYLAGYETVSDTMADPAFTKLVRGLMDEEVTPTLHVPPGADLGGYKDALIARFKNTALRHRTWQIAMDGSQKLPQRLLGTIRDRLAAGQPITRLALGVAAWMRYVTGTDEAGKPIDVRDPMAADLVALASAAGNDATKLAAALLGVKAVFGDDLPNRADFTAPVITALTLLLSQGARKTVEQLA